MIKLRPPSLNIHEVSSAELLVDDFALPLLDTQLRLHHFTIHEKAFKDANVIALRVKFKNGTEQVFRKSSKYNWVFDKQDQINLLKPFKINQHTQFKNNKEDKQIISDLLNEMYLEATNEIIGTKGKKNLLYYSVGGNKDYFNLLKLSIESIFQRVSKINFDVLFIAPESWIQDIESIKPENVVFKYHVVSDTDDGVEISKNKTKIFDFAEIGKYNKILFLDADILAARDVYHIFANSYEHEKLYVAVNKAKVTFASHYSDYHGLKHLTKDQMDAMSENNQLPFNAGQFLFLNSNKMQKHFENVNWFMNAWPGPYFFEQSFMNHYFCLYNLTDNAKLGNKVKLISTAEPHLYDPAVGDNTLVHFIAPALNAIAKINFIQEYTDAHFPK